MTAVVEVVDAGAGGAGGGDRDGVEGRPRRSGRLDRRRWWQAFALGVAIAVVVAVAVVVVTGPRGALAEIGAGDGPHGPSSGFESGPGRSDTVTLALTEVYNAGDRPLRLTGWEPIEADGVDVVAVKLKPGQAPTGTFTGYPPVGSDVLSGSRDVVSDEPLPAFGQQLEPSNQPRATYLLVTGYRLQPGRDRGSVLGIRLFYDDGRAWASTGSFDVYQGAQFCPPPTKTSPTVPGPTSLLPRC